jgi:hypothetical protein
VPVPNLNNVPTQDTYVDALTVEFPRARAGFSLNVFNAAVMYTLGYMTPGTREVQWQPVVTEAFIAPSLSSFHDPTKEGLPPGSAYGGIKLRSAVAGVPANVTVA